jgi:hypothetical protein
MLDSEECDVSVRLEVADGLMDEFPRGSDCLCITLVRSDDSLAYVIPVTVSLRSENSSFR